LNNIDLSGGEINLQTAESGLSTIDTSAQYAVLYLHGKESSFLRAIFKENTLQNVIYGVTNVGAAGAVIGTAIVVVASPGIVASAFIMGGVTLLSGVSGGALAIGAEAGDEWSSRVVLIPWKEEALNELGCYGQ
jgi:hypothetical protein